MIRRFALLIVFLIPFAMTGCGDGNSNAPLDTEPHPAGWLVNHPTAALASADFADCVNCHGSDLQGSNDAVSCYSCHSFNTTPPFSIHPENWNILTDHRVYVAANGFHPCTKCHGSNLKGSAAAPSCFSTSFGTFNCHADGPRSVPHLLDGSYLNGTIHGPDAAADLTVCQQCHGEAGGPGSNPRFNIGIESVSNSGCEDCHGERYAHPQHWGSNHSDAANVQKACTLCHGVALDGVGGVGGSCFECHTTIPDK